MITSCQVVSVRAGRSLVASVRLEYLLTKNHMTSISDKQKRQRGRPATGSDPMWGVRFSSDQRALIEAFAEANGLPRSEAIRRLVDRGLQPQ